jgi:hypothetical protein
MKNSKFNLFSWLEEITVNKRDWSEFNEDQIKEFNSFLINRYLSMNPEYIELVNYTQRIPLDQKEQLYSIYRSFIPKKKVWLKYVGKNKTKKEKELESYISKYFECGLKEANEYIELLPKSEVELILTKMGLSKEEIKKIK